MCCYDSLHYITCFYDILQYDWRGSLVHLIILCRSISLWIWIIWQKILTSIDYHREEIESLQEHPLMHESHCRWHHGATWFCTVHHIFLLQWGNIPADLGSSDGEFSVGGCVKFVHGGPWGDGHSHSHWWARSRDDHPLQDAHITRNEDGALKVKVHRNKAHTEQYLSFKSGDPLPHKLGVIRTLYETADNIITEPDDQRQDIIHINNALRVCG